MAIAVIAGLTFATALTLGMVPVMYSLLDDLGDFFARHFTHGEGAGSDEPDVPVARKPAGAGRIRELAARYVSPA
jgi:hypothetical protein